MRVDATRLRDTGKMALTRSPKLYDGLRRPYALGRFWMGRAHDSDYGVFALFGDRRGSFLDVGANAGMSALSFRIHHDAPIVSIEPNPFHERDLRFAGRVARRHSFHLWAAGAEDGEMTLHVPVYRGVPLTTEASLLREEVVDSWSLRTRLGDRMGGPDFRIVERTVPIRALDCLGERPAFIKLDVQGSEYPALCGLRDTLQRSEPVLLIETPDADVQTLLAGLGYQPYDYDAARRKLIPTEVIGGGNTVFLPAA